MKYAFASHIRLKKVGDEEELLGIRWQKYISYEPIAFVKNLEDKMVYSERRIWFGNFEEIQHLNIPEHERRRICALRKFCTDVGPKKGVVLLPIDAIPNDVPKDLLGPRPSRFAIVRFMFDGLVISDDGESAAERFLALCRTIDFGKNANERRFEAAVKMVNEIAENLGCGNVNLMENKVYHLNPHHPLTRLRWAVEFLSGFLSGDVEAVFRAGLILGALYREQKWLHSVVVGNRVVTGGDKAANQRREMLGTPSPEQRIAAWREALASDAAAAHPKRGRIQRCAEELAKRFGTTVATERQFFNRNRNHIQSSV